MDKGLREESDRYKDYINKKVVKDIERKTRYNRLQERMVKEYYDTKQWTPLQKDILKMYETHDKYRKALDAKKANKK